MVPLLKSVDEYRDGANLDFIVIGWEEGIGSHWKFVRNKINWSRELVGCIDRGEPAVS